MWLEHCSYGHTYVPKVPTPNALTTALYTEIFDADVRVRSLYTSVSKIFSNPRNLQDTSAVEYDE